MLDWIQDNLVLFICIVIAFVSLITVTIILIVNKSKKDKFIKQNEELDEFISLFGGIENIIEVKARESRLSLVLNDYDKVNQEGLKQKGVSSSIKMSNKITFVIGSLAKDIEEHINSLK